MTASGAHDPAGTRVRADDLTALLDIVRRTVARLAHPLPNWTVDDARQEVVQRACERVLRKQVTLRLRDPSKKVAWVKAVARNEWRTFRREVQREAKYRAPDRLPYADGDEDEDEDGLEYYRPSVDRDPVAQTCIDRETLNEVLEAIVTQGERHSRLAPLVRAVLRGILLGVPDAMLASQLDITEDQLRNLKNRVISRVLAERFQDILDQSKRRGPKRGRKGKSGPRQRSPRDEDGVSGGDSITEAAARVAASLRVERGCHSLREMAPSRGV